MSETNENSEKNDNWFGSWLSAAKNKSCEVLEFVKKDLEEFGSAVKSEATSVVSTTGTALERTLKLDEPDSTASSMKRSISSFIGQMNEALNPSPDDSDTEAIMIVEGQDAVKLTKLQQTVYELQKSETTFTQDPDESLSKQYECWLEIIEDKLSDERLSKHLSSSAALKNQYTSLVPLKVEHSIFWKRYLFKKALLEDDLARQEAMEKREEKEEKEQNWTEDSVNWEEEEFPKDVQLSEEEQTRLLQQYEDEKKEIQEKRKSLTSIKESVGEDAVQQKTDKAKKKESPKPEKSSTPPANSSSSSTDGDWEKISDQDK